MSMIIERLFGPKSNSDSEPEKFGFERLPVESLTEDDVVKVYLDYLATGGDPVNVWEKKLEVLEQNGELERLKTEYGNDHPRG